MPSLMIFFVSVRDEFLAAKPARVRFLTRVCLYMVGQTCTVPKYLETRFIWALIFPDIRGH